MVMFDSMKMPNTFEGTVNGFCCKVALIFGVNNLKKLFSSVFIKSALSLPKLHEFIVTLSTLTVPSVMKTVMFSMSTVKAKFKSTRVMLVAKSYVVALV